MRILAVNTDEHSSRLLSQSFSQTPYQLLFVIGKEQALQVLTENTESIVIIVDFSLAAWLSSGDFLTIVSKTPRLISKHSYILLLHTNETLPFSLGRIVGQFPLEMVAKPINAITLQTALHTTALRRMLSEPTIKLSPPEKEG